MFLSYSSSWTDLNDVSAQLLNYFSNLKCQWFLFEFIVSSPLAYFSFRAIRPSLPLGGELRGETQLPLLLHFHRVALLPDGLHLWLCDHTSSTEYVFMPWSASFSWLKNRKDLTDSTCQHTGLKQHLPLTFSVCFVSLGQPDG